MEEDTKRVPVESKGSHAQAPPFPPLPDRNSAYSNWLMKRAVIVEYGVQISRYQTASFGMDCGSRAKIGYVHALSAKNETIVTMRIPGRAS